MCLASNDEKNREERLGEVNVDATRSDPEESRVASFTLKDWWVYRRLRYVRFQVRIVLVMVFFFAIGVALNVRGVINTGDALRDGRLRELAMTGGYALGVILSGLLWLWYRRRMIAANDRLCQRCLTPYSTSGLMVCPTCDHFFHGDDERAKHGYAPFRDFGGRVAMLMFPVVMSILAGRPILVALGFSISYADWLNLTFYALGAQMCLIIVVQVMKRRRDAHVRRMHFCCCEYCGHPFDWQVSEEQLKSYDSDKQPPELITCTECGETFNPLSVYRRWRYHVT